MARKAIAFVTTRLEIQIDDDQNFEEILGNMDYGFQIESEYGQIVNTEIIDWEIAEV